MIPGLGDPTGNDVLLALFLLAAFPPLATVVICTVAAPLAHLRRWWGTVMRFPLGVANIILGFIISARTQHLVPGDNDLVELLVPYIAVIVATSAVCLLGVARLNLNAERATNQATNWKPDLRQRPCSRLLHPSQEQVGARRAVQHREGKRPFHRNSDAMRDSRLRGHHRGGARCRPGIPL